MLPEPLLLEDFLVAEVTEDRFKNNLNSTNSSHSNINNNSNSKKVLVLGRSSSLSSVPKVRAT